MAFFSADIENIQFFTWGVPLFTTSGCFYVLPLKFAAWIINRVVLFYHILKLLATLSHKL